MDELRPDSEIEVLPTEELSTQAYGSSELSACPPDLQAPVLEQEGSRRRIVFRPYVENARKAISKRHQAWAEDNLIGAIREILPYARKDGKVYSALRWLEHTLLWLDCKNQEEKTQGELTPDELRVILSNDIRSQKEGLARSKMIAQLVSLQGLNLKKGDATVAGVDDDDLEAEMAKSKVRKVKS